ncbi:hypothetical protein H1C71_023697, partial [Ictidomys tridecemlineatus]
GKKTNLTFPPKETSLSILDSKQAYPLFWRETLSFSSKDVYYTNIIEKIVYNKGSQFLWYEMCRNVRDKTESRLQTPSAFNMLDSVFSGIKVESSFKVEH